MATQTLYALFPTVLDAERAIGALTDNGIHAENIGVIARTPAEEIESPRVRNLYRRIVDEPVDDPNAAVVHYRAETTATPPTIVRDTLTPADSTDTRENVEAVGKQGITTTTPADAAAGAAIGTGVGLVTGLVATALAVTGVGFVGGLLAAAVAATVATTAAGAVVGGVAGYLRDMGMPQTAAERVADRVREGDYLISVGIDTSQFDDVSRILNKYNAVGIDDAQNFANRPVQAALNPGTPIPQAVEPVVETDRVVVPVAENTYFDSVEPEDDRLLVPVAGESIGTAVEPISNRTVTPADSRRYLNSDIDVDADERREIVA